MATRKSTRSLTGTTAKAKRIRGRLTGPQIAHRYLRTTAVQWEAFRIEYFLTALIEAWDCPDDRFDALATEYYVVAYGAQGGALSLPLFQGATRHHRAFLLTAIEFAVKDALAERRAWPPSFLHLKRAIGGDHDQLLEAARQALDEFSQAQTPA